MPAELAKALLEDGEKETKESFENVPSLVIATKEDEGNADASIPISDQRNEFEGARDNLSVENGINNSSNNALNNPSINAANNATNTTPPPSPLSDNSDLFF